MGVSEWLGKGFADFTICKVCFYFQVPFGVPYIVKPTFCQNSKSNQYRSFTKEVCNRAVTNQPALF